MDLDKFWRPKQNKVNSFPNLQEVTDVGNETTTIGYSTIDDSFRILKVSEFIGYWTYAVNKKEAKENPQWRVEFTIKPKRRTRWFLSWFGIYWVDKESKNPA